MNGRKLGEIFNTMFMRKDLDPFKSENWVSVRELVLDSEPSEEKYINPSLAKYPTMLKRAGARDLLAAIEAKKYLTKYGAFLVLYGISQNLDTSNSVIFEWIP
ncbi:hypothetical protein RhiirA4_472081 [Rhizophagus irregularis]|uniref:Uncharacterized protein n=1 Tax=Rhizophagus irregularis TaxID=588596 RepID=A0A2I1H4B7_9GLOM|nr:hypothetical protein RhiirA4_472081 [Rhizophagus irregularis]